MMRPPFRKCPRLGAAAAELALVLPFLTLMFAVALDYCRVFYVTQTVQSCAWAGAMYASGNSSNPNAASMTAAAQQGAVVEGTTLQPSLAANQVSVSFQGNNAVVTVQYQFQALTPLMGEGGTVTITRTATLAMAPRGP